MLTIREAKEQKLIPEEYWGVIEDKCYCGSDLLTSENLKTQECSNVRCPYKTAGKMIQMLNRFGIIGFGRKMAEKYIRQYDVMSHMQILVASKDEMANFGFQIEGQKTYLKIQKILQSKYTFSEVLGCLALPNIGTETARAFRPFFSYTVFLRYLEIKNLSMFEYLIGIYGIGDIKAREIMKTFKDFEVEISMIEKIFKLKAPPKKEVLLVMTGTMYYYNLSKKEFISYLNAKFEGEYNFIWTPSALESADHIITCFKYGDKIIKMPDGTVVPDVERYDFMENEPELWMTKKHKRAIEISKIRGEDILMTPDELVEYYTNLKNKDEGEC